MEDGSIIYVWHCCGEFGFDLPWGRWMSEGVWPTCDPTKPYIFLYSALGQAPENLDNILFNVQKLRDSGVICITIDDLLVDAELMHPPYKVIKVMPQLAWAAALTRIKQIKTENENRDSQ